MKIFVALIGMYVAALVSAQTLKPEVKPGTLEAAQKVAAEWLALLYNTSNDKVAVGMP